MAQFTIKWKERLTSINILLEGDALYVDDGRVFLYGLRAGWRFHGGGLWYSKQWEEEDVEMLAMMRTKNILAETMKNITSRLNFTMETGEEFDDSWLPTLDISLLVNNNNQILYKFFEKPTAIKDAKHL